jgi:hypothetical protein
VNIAQIRRKVKHNHRERCGEYGLYSPHEQTASSYRSGMVAKVIDIKPEYRSLRPVLTPSPGRIGLHALSMWGWGRG